MEKASRLFSYLTRHPLGIRLSVQILTGAICIWIGIEFQQFVEWGRSGGTLPFRERPPGVEGFLPLSALISTKHWMVTGMVNQVHPAALFIFLAVVLVSIVVKKAFCSFLCPVGTISEFLWRLGQGIHGWNLRLPRWLDYPLRSLKYLLLFYFIWAIGSMDLSTVTAFVHSPYNKVADIKMYLFFANISGLALKVLIVLGLMSFFIKNLWCRFLCPYGALLGIVSMISPLKVTRTKESCIDCKRCTRACPANIEVHTSQRVWSDECTSCLECVAVCPVKNTLEIRGAGKTFKAEWLAVLVIGLFFGVMGGAMALGHWKNNLTSEEYLRRFSRLDSPLYQHARGQVPSYSPND
jgi:NAD-dependent dihydropyrimidine dehydrogenase PreA subunit